MIRGNQAVEVGLKSKGLFSLFMSSAFWVWTFGGFFSVHVCKGRIGENKRDFRDCTAVDFRLQKYEIPLLKT